ncbi:MAG: DUF2807 domain-containing protein [candidate division Zixibacteria bacterium]|nr:DUF2807 domain-containing protein [candidate division Zixibacteria bacterium]MBU1471086.1 DUF2807 domain-containing protein [candidate division Zixibacteria bacterium]
MYSRLLHSILVIALIVSLPITASARKIRGSGEVVTENRDVSGIDGVELATIGTLHIEIGDTEKLTIEAEDNLIEYFDTEVHGGTLVIDNNSRLSLHPRKPIRYFLTVKELKDIEISSSGGIEAPDIKTERFRATISSSGNFQAGNLEVKSLDIRISSSGNVELGEVIAQDIEIDISSSGDVTLESLNAKMLIVDISSSGDIEIWGGHVDEQEVTINSSGDYMAKRLESNTAQVYSGSSGDATIWVVEDLEARLGSSGDVNYAGDPQVRERAGSSGRVRHIR